MYKFKTISVVLPCYNEEEGLGKMLRCKPSFIDEVIVVDNNSDDNMVEIAKKYSAKIVHERKRGYSQIQLYLIFARAGSKDIQLRPKFLY